MSEWRTISGGDIVYLSASKMQQGQEVEGTYVGSSVDAQYGNQKYEIETADGTTVINGCGHLDFLMRGVEAGSYIRVTFLGKEKISTGKMAGKMANKFSVAVKDSRSDANEAGAKGDTTFAPQSA